METKISFDKIRQKYNGKNELWRALVTPVTGGQMVVDEMREGALELYVQCRPSVQREHGVNKVLSWEQDDSWLYNEGCTVQGRKAADKSPRVMTVLG